MAPRHKEHREIANGFGGREFSLLEFKQCYHRAYPTRPLGSMIPSDYCVNLNPEGAEDFPKFLRWLARGRYELT